MKKKIESCKKDETIIRPWWYRGVIVTEGKGAVVKDVYGNEYIDCSSAFFVLNIGYSHPEVIKVIKKQVSKVIHTTMFQSNIPAIELAEKLAKIVPVKGEVKKVFYTVGGAEAVEVATRFAREYTKKYEIIALRGSYHGVSTYGALTLTGQQVYKTGAGPLLSGIYHAAAPYCYRCEFNQEYPDCDLLCAKDIEHVIKTETGNNVAAVVAEPIMGAGGAIIPPDDYLREVKRICDEYGILLIADEVQTFFGRSGKKFGVEHSVVNPDIICIAKTVGGGLPLSAVVTREEIATEFTLPIPPTYSGNALACAAGLKTIEITEREKLWENAAKMGEYFTKRFKEISKRHPSMGDVRFKGLMGGIELVKDQKTKEPAVEEAKNITPELTKNGLLVFPGGLSKSVFRIQPPLTITEEQAEKVIEVFDKVLKGANM